LDRNKLILILDLDNTIVHAINTTPEQMKDFKIEETNVKIISLEGITLLV
jgi:hypothetical protein